MKKEIFLNQIKNIIEQNDLPVREIRQEPDRKTISFYEHEYKMNIFPKMPILNYYYHNEVPYLNNIYYGQLSPDKDLNERSSKLQYILLKQFTKNEEIDIKNIYHVIDSYKEFVNKFNYFKKLELNNLNLSFDDLFSKNKESLKELCIGKSYYGGLSKAMNNEKGFDHNYSGIKIRLNIVNINNENFELGLVISLPILSNIKFKSLVLLTGTTELKEHFNKASIENFNIEFRKNVVRVIAKNGKIRGKEKKELFNKTDSELIDLFLIAEMQGI